MAERKSAVREVQVEVDESSRKKREGILLGVILVGAVAIVSSMFVVAAFLSNKDTNAWKVPTAIFGVSALITAALYLWARTIKVRKA